MLINCQHPFAFRQVAKLTSELQKEKAAVAAAEERSNRLETELEEAKDDLENKTRCEAALDAQLKTNRAALDSAKVNVHFA